MPLFSLVGIFTNKTGQISDISACKFLEVAFIVE